jgi:DNA-binding MarR family transcriptional regulator
VPGTDVGDASGPVAPAAPPRPGPPAQELWRTLVDVYQPVLRDVVADLERHAGIDSGTYSVLAYLDQADGSLRLGELHRLMRVRYSQPGLSRLVQRMEADDLLRRSVDPDDRRAVSVSLTRTGRARFRTAHTVYQAALDEHLGALVDPADAAVLTAGLGRLAAAISARRAPRDSPRPSSGPRRR